MHETLAIHKQNEITCHPSTFNQFFYFLQFAFNFDSPPHSIREYVLAFDSIPFFSSLLSLENCRLVHCWHFLHITFAGIKNRKQTNEQFEIVFGIFLSHLTRTFSSAHAINSTVACMHHCRMFLVKLSLLPHSHMFNTWTPHKRFNRKK